MQLRTEDVSIDPIRNVAYLIQRDNGTVIKLDLATRVQTFILSNLQLPISKSLDPVANLLYIAEYSGGVISVLNLTTNTYSILARGGAMLANGVLANHTKVQFSSSVQVDTGRNLVYFSKDGGRMVRVVNRKTGLVTRVAGTGLFSSSGNADVATEAALYSPVRLYLDFDTNSIYFSDYALNSVRLISFAMQGTVQNG